MRITIGELPCDLLGASLAFSDEFQVMNFARASPALLDSIASTFDPWLPDGGALAARVWLANDEDEVQVELLRRREAFVAGIEAAFGGLVGAAGLYATFSLRMSQRHAAKLLRFAASELDHVTGLSFGKLSHEYLWNDDLKDLHRFRCLQSLDLSSVNTITESAIEHITRARSLTDLSLQGSRISDAGIIRICGGLQHLTSLSFSFLSTISAPGWNGIVTDLLQLTTLRIRDAESIADVGIIARHKSLTCVDFGFSLESSDAVGIAAMATLSTLSLCGRAFSDEVYAHLAAMPRLTDLAVAASAPPTLAALKILVKGLSTKLHAFKAFFGSATAPTLDRAIKVISGLSELRSLALSTNYSEPLTATQVEHLAEGLPHLTRLDVGLSGIVPEGLIELSAMKQLTELSINRGSLEPHEVMHGLLTRLPKLRVLHPCCWSGEGRAYSVPELRRLLLPFVAQELCSLKALKLQPSLLVQAVPSDVASQHLAWRLNCSEISAELLEFNRLRSLTVNGSLDSALLRHVFTKTTLTSLDIGGGQLAQPGIFIGLSKLSNLTSLRILDVPTTYIREEDAEEIAALSHLEELTLLCSCKGVTDKAVMSLSALKRLRYAKFNELINTSLAVCAGSRRPLAVGIIIDRLDCTREAAEALLDNKLTELSAVKLSQRDIAFISTRTALRTLRLRHSFTLLSEDLVPLATRLRGLELLEIEGMSTLLTETMAVIATMPSLRSLILRRATRVRGDMLAPLAASSTLRSLTVEGSHRFDRQTAERLPGALRAVTSLSLCALPNLDDAAAEILQKLTSVMSLNIDRCPITDVAVAGFATKMPQLVSLRLARLDALTNEGVLWLQRSPTLRHLDVSGCPSVTAEGLTGFRSDVVVVCKPF